MNFISNLRGPFIKAEGVKESEATKAISFILIPQVKSQFRKNQLNLYKTGRI